MELTKEYFDETVSQQTQAFMRYVDQGNFELATRLEKHSEEQTEQLAQIVATTVAQPMLERFDQLEQKLDTRERLEQLEARTEKLEKALHLGFGGTKTQAA